MITKDKVTDFFCIADDFHKVFDAENAGKLLLSEDGVKRRRRNNKPKALTGYVIEDTKQLSLF